MDSVCKWHKKNGEVEAIIMQQIENCDNSSKEIAFGMTQLYGNIKMCTSLSCLAAKTGYFA